MTEEGLQKRLKEACTKGDKNAMEQLITIGADPNYRNPGENYYQQPIYYAARGGHLDLLRSLIENHHCDVHYTARAPRGTTLLHIASLHGHEHIVKYLTVRHGLDASVKNKHQCTPLHYACVGGHPTIVQYLIERLKCDPQATGDQDNKTPLHTASRHGKLGIVRYLINVHHCDPSVTTTMGDTPLHLACQYGHADVMQFLITESKCDPMVRNSCAITPLHYAAQHNHVDIVRRLILDYQCDPMARTNDDFTVLHLGCRYGRVDVVRVALEEAKMNPSVSGPGGKTAIQLAYDHEIVKLLIRHGAKAQDAQVDVFPGLRKKQMEDIIRVMVIGDPGNGKSTLVEALMTPSTRGIFSSFMPSPTISGVSPFTAGIIPHEFCDSEFGHVIMFDFAGQNEYYASHSVVIESAMTSTASVFVVVIDLSQEQEKIKRRLHYWIQFVENNRPDFVSQPHIIVVGSHVDVIKKSRRSIGSVPIKSQLKNIEDYARETVQSVTKLHFAGFFAINCQKVYTHRELRSCLAHSCHSLRSHMNDDRLCHAFSVFLFHTFRGKLMCTIREVSEAIRCSNTPFPLTPGDLTHLCNCLRKKVNIMFLKHSSKPEESTIILDVKTLLAEIQAVIFAPKGFSQHKIRTRSGVVSLKELKKQFTKLEPRVIAQCMQQLEFCHEIYDDEILELFHGRKPDGRDCELDGPPTMKTKEEYVFFPCLIDKDNPEEIWRPDETDPIQFVYYMGWCLQCSQVSERRWVMHTYMYKLCIYDHTFHTYNTYGTGERHLG